TIDGISIAKEIGLGGRINTILQAAFFKLANIIPVEDAVKFMKDAATASYGKKGEKIVAMNHAAIERGIAGAVKIDVPADWANATDEDACNNVEGDRQELVSFVKNILAPVNAQQGDNLPVSTFKDMADGTFPQGSAAYEKRGIAVDVPEWKPENCIQCNFCSYVCPHAVIRPIVMTGEEAANAPKGMKMKDMTGMPGYKFAIAPSVLDCTGCGSCANVCPGMKGNKALEMKPLDSQLGVEEDYLYGQKLPVKAEVWAKFKPESVKGSQFKQPLLEFSGACAGCGETPYAKLATQLFGDRMYIANATGCSSIWGGSAPSTPYTVDKRGFGPAWANSLFEDNAEYGYGIFLAQQHIRDRLEGYLDELHEAKVSSELNASIDNWKATKEDGKANREATDTLIASLEKIKGNDKVNELIANKDFLAKKSVWILGGDGWAYDIGFGGLDHVIASGQDVNILVFDTEVYSNTGGQSSKASPAGSVAQFAAAGKSTKKKDLAAMAMSYGYVYVAQIAMGSDYNQCIKAFTEAESYHGPSLIIAYAPCINHGIRGGMGISQTEEKKAVAAGYWHLFRFDPRVADEGNNPFFLDSKVPTASYKDFIMNEVRYSSLTRSFPERAGTLFDAAEKQAKEKFDHLTRLADK
ncbi:MAG TPA: thiamine pyrophosphate-dependent enzyme, partial [Clostridia bacterium]|nr:thiamine pyrophosphate-dependent enzyme [Clostridia bacterium]